MNKWESNNVIDIKHKKQIIMFFFQSFMGIYIHFRIFVLVKQYNRKLCVKSFIVSSDLVSPSG